MKVRHYSALVGLSIRQSAAMLSAPQGTPARKFLRPNRAAHCKLIQKYPYSISQLRSKPLSSQQLDSSKPELISNAQRAFFRVFYNDVYEVPLPPRHRFPMKKYAQVRKEVQRRLAALPSADTDFVECGTNFNCIVTYINIDCSLTSLSMLRQFPPFKNLLFLH